jgi:hypothetical protein
MMQAGQTGGVQSMAGGSRKSNVKTGLLLAAMALAFFVAVVVNHVYFR